MFLPLWDVIGHHANASHVSGNLSTISCKGEEEIYLALQLKFDRILSYISVGLAE